MLLNVNILQLLDLEAHRVVTMETQWLNHKDHRVVIATLVSNGTRQNSSNTQLLNNGTRH